jgi:hypothetical protein
MRAASEAALQRGGESVVRGYQTARRAALRFAGVRALYVVAPLVLLQLVAVLLLALRVQHNGWLYHSTGAATTFWLSEWAIGHGYLPATWIGYGLPVAFGWVPLLGTTLLEGLPAIVLLQTLVLLPLTTVLIYALARRIAGPLFAAVAAVVWVVAPYASLVLQRPDYRGQFEPLFLPQALGLVNTGDFASLVVLLAAAYFAFRVLDERRGQDALLVGLLIGFAVGIKPANVLMLPVPAIAFALARCWRSILLYAVALAPALLTLAVWKHRGLGEVPLFALSDPLDAFGHYLRFDWQHFNDNMHAVREFFWSRLLLEYLPIAGAFAVIRKSTAKGVYLALWVVAYFGGKGAIIVSNVSDVSYFRLAMPGLPAYVLLASAIMLLVPGWGRRVPAARPRETPPSPSISLAVAVALLAVAPFPVVALARPLPPERVAFRPAGLIGGPISPALDVRATQTASGVRLSWSRPDTGGSDVLYAVYRVPAAQGDGCAEPAASSLPQMCSLAMPVVARVDATSVDDSPPAGRYVYRVGVLAGWSKQPADAALVLLGPPVAVTVR